MAKKTVAKQTQRPVTRGSTARDLVIVESPTKARTIGKILGSGYAVTASLGHVRDLPQSRLGVAIGDGFQPEYVVPREKRQLVSEIQELAKDAPHVYLATDPDREGEAISWHLVEAAGVDPSVVRRVVFHEITGEAVKRAFLSPRSIDMDMVDAQQARRVLDRLVGYTLSPLISRKLRWWGLSAGRVQSAALRIVVEREREIEAFVPREHWSIEATLRNAVPDAGGAEPVTFVSWLHSRVGQKQRLVMPDAASAGEIARDLEGATYAVAGVKRKEVEQRPTAPFITSTLQQEAWRQIRFPAKRTMAVAQQLYEGVSLGAQGSEGLITYMRTDSTNVAVSAVQEARDYIREAHGAEYVPPQPRQYTKKVKGAQEAHEAVRPTSVLRTPAVVRPFLNPEQARLYDLVWRRFVASQMADARLDQTSVDVHAASALSSERYLFRVTGSVLRFPGFRALYLEARDDQDDDDDQRRALPPLADGDGLDCRDLAQRQHFTQPPPRYSDASLIRALEEKGIGRPSTYAATVSTIQDRGYVERDRGRLTPTPLGKTVSDLLTEHFGEIVDLGFTAQMEQELDDIAQGQRGWQAVLRTFYDPFNQNVTEAADRIPRLDIPTGETCEVCGLPMVLKRNRWGSTFLSCSGFPECRNAKSPQTKTGVDCPVCGGDLVERQARKGKRRGTFYGCSSYPTCTFAVNQRPLPNPCPECGGLLLQRGRSGAKCNQCKWQGVVEGQQQEEDAAEREPEAVGV